MFRRDQPAVAMGLCAWLARTKLTPRSWRSAAGWTADSEYVFGSEFFVHTGKMMAQSQGAGMVNFEQSTNNFIAGAQATGLAVYATAPTRGMSMIPLPAVV